MNELIPVNYENDKMTISARKLHEFLEIKTHFKDWFPRMTEYGFIEGEDFNLLKNEQVQNEGSREVKRMVVDYVLTIDSAKEISMIQRNEKGKMARKYFIELEKKWNTPDQVMARAIKLANSMIETLKIQRQEDLPKIEFYDELASSKNAIDMRNAANILNIPGIGRTKLFDILRKEQILTRDNSPYQRFIDAGYFRVVINKWQDKYSDYHQYTKTLVLPKGLNHIRKIVEKHKN